MKLILACCIATLVTTCGYCATIDVTTQNVLPANSAAANSTNLQTLVNGATAGDMLYFPDGNYSFATQVNDNIGLYFRGKSKESVSLTKVTGYGGGIIAFATTAATSGGGISNLTFVGCNNSGGNCGAVFGKPTITASNFIVENCDFKKFSQYGMLIYNAENFALNDIKVLNHGDTVTVHASCIGICIYPRIQTQHARLTNIYSEISPSSVCNSAAIKLQVMQCLEANNIYAKGGTEECMVVDALKDSTITNLTIEAVSASPGLALRTYDSVYDITGGNIVLDGVVTLGTFSRAITIGTGDAGGSYVSCDGITLMNVVTDAITASNYGVAQNSKFINIQCTQFRLDEYPLNSNYRFTGNQFVNIAASSGSFTITGDYNSFDNIRSVNAGIIGITGNYNNINNCYSESCSANGMQIDGDYNTIVNCHIKSPDNRPVWLKTGSSNNVISSLLYKSTYDILDNGTSNVNNNNYRY